MADIAAGVAAIIIMATGSPPIPERYDGMYAPDTCGAYTNVCWWELRRAGIGPLTTEPRTGLTWLRTMGRTLWCESRHNSRQRFVNRNGSVDRGIAQINDRWHPDVSDEQADDPAFAIAWMADRFARGQQWLWNCYKLLFMGWRPT